MSITAKRIDEKLKSKGLTRYKLSKLINKAQSTLSEMVTGKALLSPKVMEGILPFLEVEKDVLIGWILADKYPIEVLELAIKYKKEKSPHDERVFTSKVDEKLRSMNLSRTAFSKVINYSQGGLNEIIIGKRTLSKKVKEKLCQAFNLSEDEIESWIIADKYSFQTLETAIQEFIITLNSKNS